MPRDAAFERERRAFLLIQESIKDMLRRGYETHVFDNAMQGEMDIVFIGVDADGRKDVKKMRMPYEYIAFTVEDDTEAMKAFKELMELHRLTSARIREFLAERIKNMTEVDNGRSGGGEKEYQA